jgi:hypothetical protein
MDERPDAGGVEGRGVAGPDGVVGPDGGRGRNPPPGTSDLPVDSSPDRGPVSRGPGTIVKPLDGGASGARCRPLSRRATGIGPDVSVSRPYPRPPLAR